MDLYLNVYYQHFMCKSNN